MKKLYSALAFATVAVSVSASAAAPLTVTSDASAFRTAVPDTQLGTVSKNTKLADVKLEVSAASESHSRMKVAPAGEWNNIGQGTWFEGLFSVYSDIPSGLSWQVDIEESATTPGYYRLLPYSVDCEISQLMGATDSENYVYVNATNPDKVYIDGDITPYGIFTFSHLNEENEWTSYEYYGTLEDKVISFEAETFAIYGQTGWALCNLEGEFAIALPGADVKDYALNVSSTSLCGTTGIAFNKVGADIASVKATVLPGYYPGGNENYAIVAANGDAINAQTGSAIGVTLSGRDLTTVLLAALDAEGNVKKGAALYFVGTEDTDTWTSVGTATYNEVLLAADWGVDEEEISVDVEESTTTPGLYRLAAPYANHSYFGVAALTHDHTHYIYVNASNPNKVYVEPSVLGLGFSSYGEVYMWSLAHYYTTAGYESLAEQYGLFGKKTDNEITMPQGTLVLGYSYDNNGDFYSIDNEGDFKITLSGGAGVGNISVADENAPVEYFNLQGVRVANPENGLFIVKQGGSVSKQVIR